VSSASKEASVLYDGISSGNREVKNSIENPDNLIPLKPETASCSSAKYDVNPRECLLVLLQGILF
jgi:hypothetical protein